MHAGPGVWTLPPHSLLWDMLEVTTLADGCPSGDCACSNGHLFLSTPELRLGSYKEQGVLVDINTKEQCLSLGKVNISVRRQKPAEAIFLCAGKRSCKHKAAHSKETDDLCKPSSAKPSVKGLHIYQHSVCGRRERQQQRKPSQGSGLRSPGDKLGSPPPVDSRLSKDPAKGLIFSGSSLLPEAFPAPHCPYPYPVHPKALSSVWGGGKVHLELGTSCTSIPLLSFF